MNDLFISIYYYHCSYVILISIPKGITSQERRIQDVFLSENNCIDRDKDKNKVRNAYFEINCDKDNNRM